jgi:hypothetical protein
MPTTKPVKQFIGLVDKTGIFFYNYLFVQTAAHSILSLISLFIYILFSPLYPYYPNKDLNNITGLKTTKPIASPTLKLLLVVSTIV